MRFGKFMSVDYGDDSENYGEDEDIEAIRQRKMAEMQKKAAEEERQREIEAQKRALLRTILTPEARNRLDNLRLVKPDLVQALESQIIALAQANRIRIPVTDEDVKRMLEAIYQQTKKDYRIRFR